MLGLGIDIDIDIKKVDLPFYFDRKNICVSCGAEGSLVFIDKYGKESRQEIRAFDHIECKRCNRIYSILWKKDPDSNKMYPSAVNPSITRDFTNLIDNTIKITGVKEFD